MLNLDFIKRHWSLFKEELMLVIRRVYDTRSFDKMINMSFIALIPKTKRPIRVTDYRSISLIGCIYKILIKVLINS
ncbi:hypothetical protein DITRI_Ditri09bG0043900 [Diplodiscus trichospermus]